MSRRALAAGLLALAAALAPALEPAPAGAFVFTGSRWPQVDSGGGQVITTLLHVNLVNFDGVSAPVAGITWNDAFDASMAIWNSSTGTALAVVTVYSDPCSIFDSRNGVDFRFDLCGVSFGASTLAVTLTSNVGALTTETDVLFNDTVPWDVYAGPLHPVITDFVRVAIHELGHVLGLGHEDDVPAIMHTLVSDIDNLRADDVAGVLALYGGCVLEASLGPNEVRSGALEVTDCFTSELDLTLSTLVDLYPLTLPTAGTLEVLVQSSQVDPFLSVFEALPGGGLGAEIAFDNDSGPGDDALLSLELDAGDYVIAATSNFEGETGDYSVTTVLPEPGPWLGLASGLAGLGALHRRRRV